MIKAVTVVGAIAAVASLTISIVALVKNSGNKAA